MKKTKNKHRTIRVPEGYYITNITYLDYEHDEENNTIQEPKGIIIFYRPIEETN